MTSRIRLNLDAACLPAHRICSMHAAALLGRSQWVQENLLVCKPVDSLNLMGVRTGSAGIVATTASYRVLVAVLGSQASSRCTISSLCSSSQKL